MRSPLTWTAPAQTEARVEDQMAKRDCLGATMSLTEQLAQEIRETCEASITRCSRPPHTRRALRDFVKAVLIGRCDGCCCGDARDRDRIGREIAIALIEHGVVRVVGR